MLFFGILAITYFVNNTDPNMRHYPNLCQLVLGMMSQQLIHVLQNSLLQKTLRLIVKNVKQENKTLLCSLSLLTLTLIHNDMAF